MLSISSISSIGDQKGVLINFVVKLKDSYVNLVRI